VTSSGQQSQPFPIRVLQSDFGILTEIGAGYGPGAAFDANSSEGRHYHAELKLARSNQAGEDTRSDRNSRSKPSLFSGEVYPVLPSGKHGAGDHRETASAVRSACSPLLTRPTERTWYHLAPTRLNQTER
jgi:hypothetical protein